MRLTLSLLICSFAFAQEPVRPGTPGGRELLAPPESEVFSFAVFSDRTGGRDSGLPILIQAVEDVNRFQPAFVMTVGDLINGYNDRLSWLAQMARYKTIMEDLTMPWYPVAGNHDVYGDGGSPADRGNLALYQEHFGPLYYSFDYKDVHFVVLYSDEALAFRNPAANQNMSEAQLLWLQADLEASDARAVYVFLHHPRWQEYYDGCNWPEVHAILAADGRVRTVFAGHMHAYRHDGWIDGIEYITLGMTGASGGSDLSLGELHHFNIVAVGPDSATMAVVPVGGTYARDFVTADQHRLLKGLSWYGCGRFIEDVRGPEGTLAFEAMNPAAVPLALELLVPGEEPRALMLEAGACARVELPARPFWEGAALTLRTTVVGDDGVPRVREHSARPPRRPRQRIPSATATSERVLVLDGEDSCLRLPPSASWQPISGLTVEMQVKAAPHGGRSGLVSKAENSAFGLFFGLAVWKAFEDDGLTELSIPVGQLTLFAVAAVVVGVLAAVFPARRAGKLDVLQAIATE